MGENNPHSIGRETIIKGEVMNSRKDLTDLIMLVYKHTDEKGIVNEKTLLFELNEIIEKKKSISNTL